MPPYCEKHQQWFEMLHSGIRRECVCLSCVAEKDEQRDPDEEAYLAIKEMFSENDMTEFGVSPETWKRFHDYFNRVCEDNRKFRGLHKEGVKKSA